VSRASRNFCRTWKPAGRASSPWCQAPTLAVERDLHPPATLLVQPSREWADPRRPPRPVPIAARPPSAPPRSSALAHTVSCRLADGRVPGGSGPARRPPGCAGCARTSSWLHRSLGQGHQHRLPVRPAGRPSRQEAPDRVLPSDGHAHATGRASPGARRPCASGSVARAPSALSASRTSLRGIDALHRWREVARQHAPRAAGAGQVEDGLGHDPTRPLRRAPEPTRTYQINGQNHHIRLCRPSVSSRPRDVV